MMALLAMLALLAAGCGGSQEAPKKAETEKVLYWYRTGFCTIWVSKEGSDEFTGFDMDLIRAIGTKLGYKVEISSMGFDALIPALNSGNIDVAIAGMSITDERKK